MKLPLIECGCLIGIQDGEVDGDFHCIRNEITDHRRWTITHTVTLRYKNDKYFRTSYQRPATEYQSIDPWWGEDEVTFTEVEPVQKMITVFEVKK